VKHQETKTLDLTSKNQIHIIVFRFIHSADQNQPVLWESDQKRALPEKFKGLGRAVKKQSLN
jgi:hypothetical protein